MRKKITPSLILRLRELKLKYDLSAPVIAERLGISERSVFLHLAKLREELKTSDVPPQIG
jgi:hypothetical protein